MNLTTLPRTKAVLSGSLGTGNLDTTLSQLIVAASAAACQFTGRTFQRFSGSNVVLNGSGTSRLMMPWNPIVSVTAPVAVDGYQYQPAPVDSFGAPDTSAAGYGFDRKFLYLYGNLRFRMGKQNVFIKGIVCAFSTSQADTVPTVAAQGARVITPTIGSMVDSGGQPMATGGYAFSDNGVSYTGGAALAKVATNPATGQYTFDATTGAYNFSTGGGDDGKAVTLSYDFVPADVEQAVIETIGLKIKQRDFYGIASKSLAQETVSYRDVALSASAKSLLQPYRFVVSP